MIRFIFIIILQQNTGYEPERCQKGAVWEPLVQNSAGDGKRESYETIGHKKRGSVKMPFSILPPPFGVLPLS